MKLFVAIVLGWFFEPAFFKDKNNASNIQRSRSQSSGRYQIGLQGVYKMCGLEKRLESLMRSKIEILSHGLNDYLAGFGDIDTTVFFFIFIQKLVFGPLVIRNQSKNCLNETFNKIT